MYRLEPMREEHLKLVLEWRNRPEVRQHMFTQHVISWEEHMRWFKSLEGNPRMLYFVVYADNEPLGVVSFTEINRRDKNAFWGFYSGDMSRRGIGTQMEYLALEYAFEVLELEKLCGEILVTNKKVLDFHRKTSAMRVEGLLKKQFFNGESYVDVYRVALMRDEWLDSVKERAQQVLAGNAPEVVSGIKVGYVHEGSVGAASVPELERLVQDLLPGGRVVQQTLSFPQVADGELAASLRVATQIGRAVILEVKMQNERGKVAMDGEIEVLLPEANS